MIGTGGHMLKEVGASGQISLGKKYAGRLFKMIVHPDGRFELIPVRVVKTAGPAIPAFATASDGWVPPGGYDGCSSWALENREALEEYALGIEQHGTAAEQLERFLEAHPEMLEGDDA
jgi:hypothetical protein